MQLTALKNVSDKRQKQFNKLGIYSQEQLVKHFPRDYLDLTKISLLRDAYHNDMILTCAEVLNVETNPRARISVVKALCQQQGHIFTAIWFNQPYVAGKLKRGTYLFYGRVRNEYGMGATLTNPTFETIDNVRALRGIIPVYPLADTLTQKLVRSAILQSLKNVKIESVIPYALQKKYNLSPLKDAYYKLHAPEKKADVREASERIAIEEYFLLLSAFKVIKGDRHTVRTNKYNVSTQDVKAFISRFPFEFTDGQKKGVNDVFQNITSPEIMNRLLQGDVGSGKTAVALTAIYMAVKSGFQVAMIAPTAVLARQNANLIERYFPDYNVAFLAGSTSAKEKKAIKNGLATGQISIVCGTHAVIQPDVEFANLSLVVCDEQHRFGVAQRSSLAEKGQNVDVLIMSATPIPRTLSLIFYGDLDITTIKDKPNARKEIITSIIPERKYGDMYRYISEQAKQGNQTYFVCPKIEGDEEGTIMSVSELYENLKIKMPTTKIALLHGKMKEKQKDEIMLAFKNKEYDVLVSTTVIEVGVDVPDATIMVIYNAERFGLSQLHQLRGRVGRGDKQSYCFLLSGAETPEAKERLAVIKNSANGFEIAEMDLEIRGGGDFMGTHQSGKFLTELNRLKFSTGAIFMAKAITDEAFSGAFDVSELKARAVEKYDSLKDVVLN